VLLWGSRIKANAVSFWFLFDLSSQNFVWFGFIIKSINKNAIFN
jgi:hypothetical protein